MSEHTSIEWTDATWNPIGGCTRVDEGCRNCYAEIMAARFSGPGQWGEGLARMVQSGGKTDHRWTGQMRPNTAALHRLLSWRKPRRIFVNSTSDLFHAGVPDAWIDQVFAVMALSPQHTFQVLTKRPERAREYLADTAARIDAIQDWADDYLGDNEMPFTPQWPLSNVWLGTSISDQASANTRIPHLLATPAAVRFVSAEPLLGPVDLEIAWNGESALDGECWGDCGWCSSGNPPMHNCQKGRQTGAHWEKGRDGLDWVIVGGESGPGARPMHPDWARSLRDQCVAAGVPLFFKQWGEWEVLLDRERDDPDWRADYTNTYGDHGKSRWLNIAGGRGFHGERFHVMHRVGKKAAGRLLDGQEWSQMPEIAP